MVIVRCQGGMGNQMFQYALYRVLRHWGGDVYLDMDDFDPENPRDFELENAFGITFRKFRYNPAIRWLSRAGGLMRRHRNRRDPRSVIGAIFVALANRMRKRTRTAAGVVTDREFVDLAELNYQGKMYFDGYWQSARYFQSISDEIRNAFCFPPSIDSGVERLLATVHDCNSVSIHFRRGDYSDDEIYKIIYGGICTEKYYEKAIVYIERNVSSPKYFIFSDDIEYAKSMPLLRNLIHKEFVSVSQNNVWDDMKIMSNCKHNIIANSSYSWWASWLNANSDKIIIAPSRWVNKNHIHPLSDLTNIFDKNWILIDP